MLKKQRKKRKKQRKKRKILSKNPKKQRKNKARLISPNLYWYEMWELMNKHNLVMKM
jgi:hypothetical protein